MEEKKTINWTPEQKLAIETKGKNLLLSASAGSGKTTVMIERIVHLMQTEHVPISKFLVVTFTKASAADMKQKLVNNLMKLEPTEEILEQIEQVAVSDISNLHSFCSRLIQTYFYEVDVDPAFHIIDGADAEFLKQKAAEKLFDEKEKTGNEAFFELFEIFQKKRKIDWFKEVIFKFNDYLNSNINGEEWLKNCIENSYNTDLSKNECARIINNSVCARVEDCVIELNEMAKHCLDTGAQAYYEYLTDLATNLGSVHFKNSFITNAKNIFDYEIPKRPTVKGYEDLKDEVKNFLDDFKSKVASFKANFVSDDEKKIKSDILTSKKHIEELYSLTCEFNEIYSKIKKDVNGLDFHDLEILALKILENPAIKSAVQTKYEYVFVDEYQDINAIQEEIISRVSRENNRFMVGDIKQSIYAFRLCDPDIFLEKQERYKIEKEKNMLIPLNCNFRSDKKILKFVDNVFSGVMTDKFGGVDYAKESCFEPNKDNLDLPESMNLCFINLEKKKPEQRKYEGVYSVKEHTELDSEETEQAIAEARYVAAQIAQLVDKNNPNSMNYSDIAILVQSRNKNIKKFIQALKSLGVNVSSDESQNLLELDYIKELVNFVKLAISENNDILMFKVMKSKLFGFLDQELVELRKLDLKERFFNLVKLDGLIKDENLKNKLLSFNEKLSKYKKLARVLKLKDFIKKVIDDFAVYEINYVSADGEASVENIERFISVIPDVSCSEFVLDYENFSVQIENESGEDAVKLMSIHRSKGIEFKAVFLVNTSNQFNIRSTYGDVLFEKNLGIGLSSFDLVTRVKSDTIVMSAIRLALKKKLVEEDQRVLYVGLTRAKEKMFVVCSKSQNKLNRIFTKYPSSFINWFEPIIAKEIDGKGSDLITFEKFEIDELVFDVEEERKQLILVSDEDINKTAFEYNFSSSCNIPLKNSVSKILHKNNKTEIEEDYENVVVSEEILKSSALRGTAYHKVFEKLDLKNLHNIEEQLRIIKEEITSEQMEFIDDKKVEYIKNIEPFSTISNNAIILKEREFYAKMPASMLDKTIEINDEFIMQGVIDLLIFDEGEGIILDYKTGGYSEEKFEKYKFQIETYAKVAERAFKKPITKKYIYLIDLQKIIKI